MHDQIQDIIAELMNQDVRTLDLIRNNAKLMGGVIGAEAEYYDLHGQPKELDFLDKKELDIQHLTFKDIERIPLGRNIKIQLGALEGNIFR